MVCCKRFGGGRRPGKIGHRNLSRNLENNSVLVLAPPTVWQSSGLGLHGFLYLESQKAYGRGKWGGGERKANAALDTGNQLFWGPAKEVWGMHLHTHPYGDKERTILIA